MTAREVIKASNPDPDDAASYCDDCYALPGQPCEPECPCGPCELGTVDRYVWPEFPSAPSTPGGGEAPGKINSPGSAPLFTDKGVEQ